MDKEALRQELTELLRKHLDKGSFSPSDRTPANGGLPLAIPSIQIEVWLYPDVATETAWNLAVETALLLQKAPVLAHKRDEGWCFRVPLYVMNLELIEVLSEEQWHAFDHTVEMSVKGFAKILAKYQVDRAELDGYVDVLGLALKGS